MIGLDTNVLTRYLAQDDARQSARASRLIETELTAARPGYLSLVVLVELWWVLGRIYGMSTPERVGILDDMLATAHFQFERRALVAAALRSSGGGKIDFADALIAALAADAGCTETLTFDKTAARLPGARLLS